ncbi:MAG: TolC family protein [Verrucomicrobia bacterium]|nr:TolC family protein [Verrucomicrobiota bacterium]
MGRKILGALGLAGLAVAGCSTAHYKESADRAAARVFAQKTSMVPNMAGRFSIEQTNQLSLDALPLVSAPDESLGPDAAAERGARVISLEAALDLAVKHGRTYQNSKEQLYLDALALALTRHRFTPIFSGNARTDYQVTTEAVTVTVDALTGQPETVGGIALREEQRVASQGSLGASLLARTGARIATSFTTDFLRYLSGDPRAVTSSQLGATLTQPLWRGAGYKATMENLTQAERTFLYKLRDFSRFKRDFTVQIATAYYGVLQNRDAVRNSWRGLQNFRRNVEREKALADEGRKTQESLSLLKQSELSTETAWINAARAYKQALDQFKIQLGLSTDVHIVLDDRELAQLQIVHPDLSAEDAQLVALATRLDLYNFRDQTNDTRRRIELAANGLKPQVDLVASAGINSASGTSTGFQPPDPNRYHWSAGLNLDLPFERTAERNNYRAALILYEQSIRQLSQKEDEVKLQVRNDWRGLDQARRNYESAKLGVELSLRRVEEQELRAQIGRGTARDQVDAQNDLITQKNQLTQALVAHTIARLQFWNDMGILYIKDNGQWEELKDAKPN